MKKRNRRLVAVLSAFCALLLVSACDEGLTEVNENPNAPEDVPVENVLLGGIWDVTANSGNRGVFGQWTQLYHAENWAQHIAQPVYNDEDRYSPRDGVPGTIWQEMYFALNDLKEAKTLAETEGKDNIWAIAEIMTVYGFMVLTDYFNDIPYEDALRLDEEVAFPAYTAQSEIYPDLIARLVAVADRIDPGAEVDFSAFDPIYQGDMNGWQRFANSLRLRLAMRMADTEQAEQAAAAFAAAWGSEIFTSVTGHADVNWTAAEPSANPIYEGIVLAGRTGDFRMSESFIDRLAARDDPRLPIYAEPAASDGVYRGLRNGVLPSAIGMDAGDFSTIGSYFLAPTTPSVLLSYAEVLLLGAEAAERGWIGGNAETLYEDGIRASMEEFGISAADIDTYLTNLGPYNGLDDIWLQKWLALFLAGPEAYSEMRRVGWMDLEPAANSVLEDPSVFPGRLYYPPNEALYNPDNYPGDVPITASVWWMGTN